MYCTSCGKENDKESKYCCSCGKELIVKTSPVESRKGKPFFKKWWVWVIIVIFVLGFAGSLTDQDNPSNDNGINDNGINDNGDNSSIINNSIYEVGTTVIFEDLEITITSYKFSSYIAGVSGGMKPGSGNTWCVVYATIKNVGNKQKTLKDFMNCLYTFDLYYDETYKYNSTWLDYDDFFEAHDSINPLETINVCTNFKVPFEVETSQEKSLYVSFLPNKIDAKESVTWKLR